MDMSPSRPAPLPTHRLQRIVNGLHQRVEMGSQQTLAHLDSVRAAAEEAIGECVALEQKLVVERNVQLDASTTEWDEALSSRWDDAELRAFKAVFETVDRENHARRETKEMIEHATNEAKKRIADVEQRFLRAKDAPLKQLAATRSKLADASEGLRLIESEVSTMLASRSLQIDPETMQQIPFQTPESSHAALTEIYAALEQARVHARRMDEQPLARFFESVWWWGTCGLTFVAVSTLVILPGIAQPLWGVVAGLGATISVYLIALVGVHPWLKRAMAAEVPIVRGWLQHVRRLIDCAQSLAVDENDRELKRLAIKRDHRFEEAKNWRDQQVAEATARLNHLVKELQQRSIDQKQSASSWLAAALVEVNAQFTERCEAEKMAHERRLSEQRQGQEELRRHFDDQLRKLSQGGAERVERGALKALQILDRSRRWYERYFPDLQYLLTSPDGWPDGPGEPILPVGRVALRGNVPPQLVPWMAADQQAASDSAPLLFAPLRDQYLCITGDPAHPSVRELVRNLLLRAVTGLPAGRTQVCIVDPPGLGRDFGWLMHLADFDPALVHHRVWTQPAHIAKKVQEFSLAAEDVIQQALRNEYQSIVDYNRDAGGLAEPYRLLVWSSLPAGLDDQSWKALQSLLDTGARCGIFPILIIDPAGNWPAHGQWEMLQRRGLHLTLSADGRAFHVRSHEISGSQTQSGAGKLPLVMQAERAVDEGVAKELVKEVGRRALRASRVEVPLSKLLPGIEERWQADSSRFLEIPIGQSGVGRVHGLKLGVGTAQHAIIAGKTGSGKSSLLHALLTSAILKYSPDSLRLVLLDFKKGVEFQVYADAAVPHADIIGIESQREFGLSTLEYIDGCLQRRGGMFREAGVQDITGWNLLQPSRKMPRMLLVVDEFQELFVEDDKLTSQASLILDRIVRQGRSFGVHAVLSSQTLAGSYSLPRTTLGQMAVRIALQCDPSDAQIIFADDNPVASRLKHPGQAVYNDAGGRIEGNQPMQIGWLSKLDQQTLFAQMGSGYRNSDVSTNLLGRTIVFDGNRPAQWDAVQAEQAIAVAKRHVNPQALWAVAGESVAISPAVVIPLTQQSGRNFLLVGSEDGPAASVLNSIVASVARQAGSGMRLVCVQGARPTDHRALGLPSIWQGLSVDFQFLDSRDAAKAVANVWELLQQRLRPETIPDPNDAAPQQAAGDHATGSAETSPVLLVLIQLGRMRDLRREEDFASFGASELTADKQLEEILRDGPPLGIHTLIWAENYSTVNRWLSRTAMREIEIRIAMQMSANDSTNLLDSVAASRLGDHVLLMVDEATGQERKFRPFTAETLGEIASWGAGLDEN
jgi:DNA segregation ATPase FtsK/SpoIIIE, S-DNA-T family